MIILMVLLFYEIPVVHSTYLYGYKGLVPAGNLSVGEVVKLRPMSESELLWGSQGAISSLLHDSWLPGSSIIFITDGGMTYKMSQTVGLDSDSAVFKVSSENKDGLTVVQPPEIFSLIKKIRDSSRSTTLIVVIENPDLLTAFTNTAIEGDLLPWPTRFILITGGNIDRLAKTLAISNTMVVLANELSTRKRCSVYMFLPYSYRMVHTASWTEKSGLTYHTKYTLFPDKFRRFKDGAVMVVAGNNYSPHVSVREKILEGELPLTGPLMIFLDILAQYMNFTYIITQPPDGSWGNLFPNGSWNGMIGMILRKEINFALGPFVFSYTRAQYIDYTSPVVVDYDQLLGRRSDTEIDPWGFLMPLTSSVWAATLATLIFITSFIFLISRLDNFAHIPVGNYIRAILQQDIKVATDKNWERIILGFWLMTILILLECYSTNLITLLAVRHVKEPYQYLKDVVDDPKASLIFIGNSAITQYLMVVKSGIFYEVAQAAKEGRVKYISALGYKRTADELMSQGNYVFFSNFLFMKVFLTEDYMDKGNCKYYIAKDKITPRTLGMVVPKHSPLRRPINEGIRALVEGGLYSYWLDNAIPNQKSCKNPPTKITVKAPLSIVNIGGMFAILLSGYAMSWVTLLLEIIYCKVHLFTKSID